MTCTPYRILMKAVQIKMNAAAAAVLGATQVAYIPDGRQIKDNTILMAEAARRLHCAGRGGACIQVDNSAAFDRVRWDFMQEMLEAFGFPAPFRAFIGETVYTRMCSTG